MREIKFRAWDKNTNTMYENISILPSMECIAINVDYDHDFQEYCIDESYVVELKDVELLEYTGLKDKNGVEIYEGDIIKTHENRIQTIIWEDNGFKREYTFKRTYLGESYFETRSFDIGDSSHRNWGHEVIGNIYENPELLEK